MDRPRLASSADRRSQVGPRQSSTKYKGPGTSASTTPDDSPRLAFDRRRRRKRACSRRTAHVTVGAYQAIRFDIVAITCRDLRAGCTNVRMTRVSIFAESHGRKQEKCEQERRRCNKRLKILRKFACSWHISDHSHRVCVARLKFVDSARSTVVRTILRAIHSASSNWKVKTLSVRRRVRVNGTLIAARPA